MAKLFAMEDAEVAGDDVQLEAAPEVGEVADVEVPMVEEVGDITADTGAIEEGVEAADQLEQVEEVVEAAAGEEGEGLDPVAAEAIRIAVEAIAARVGANPKGVYALYATENFKSASSRKANTKIALEGIGEFLKDLWKKVKGALMRLWEKAKQFFATHLSSLGRVKKALESAKTRVAESSGKTKEKAYLEEAPSSLVDAFGTGGDISSANIGKFIAAHRGATEKTDSFVKFTDNLNNTAERVMKAASKGTVDIGAELKTQMKDNASDIPVGSKAAPLVGGVYITYKFEVDKAEGDLNVEVERETVEKKDSKVGLSIDDKNGLQTLIKDTLVIIQDTIKCGEKAEKRQAAFNKQMLAIEKAINEESKTAKEGAIKGFRKIVKVIYKANAKVPMADAELTSLNVKLAKAVLGYVGVCVSNYK